MSSSPSDQPTEQRWLLLIHQIPPKPDYLRVKIGRRLQRVGAVAVKNSVYVLPDGAQPLDDFRWIRAAIVEGGGEASICRADFVDGLSSHQIRQLFLEARRSDYTEIAFAARVLLDALTTDSAADAVSAGVRAEVDVARLRQRVTTVHAIDFFDAPERRVAQTAIDAVELRVRPSRMESVKAGRARRVGAEYRGRTWVTRAGVFVDRIASAWLIRTFIDPDARFKFVLPKGYRRGDRELRFDMFEAEFTHEGERCTFEVLLRHFGLDSDPALAAVAEVVHDIDLKDSRYERAEAAGVERLLAGVARSAPDDDARVERGGALFAALYESLRDTAPRLDVMPTAPDASGRVGLQGPDAAQAR